jgi:hypothetical protein
LKIKNQLFALQVKFIQNRLDPRWWSIMDFKTNQTGFSQYLGEKYLFRNKDCKELHNIPHFSISFGLGTLRLAII